MQERNVEIPAVSDVKPVSEAELAVKYTSLVRVCARPYFLVGGDGEDLIQEGMIGLLSAIRTFDPERGVRFETYAEVCIRHRIISTIRHSSGNGPNSFISLESQRLSEIPDQRLVRDPEELVIARERVLEIADRLYDGLSKFESAVLKLFLEGRTYDEMSRLLGKPYKSVDNAVQRIRRKRKNGDTR